MDLHAALAQLRSGGEVLLQAGTYTGGAYLRGLSDIRIIGAPGARIVSGGNGLKLENCRNVTVEGLEIAGSQHHGLMIVRSQGVTLRALVIHDVAGSGVLTGHTGGVEVRACAVSHTKDHAVYLSAGGDDLTVIGCVLSHATRCGVQVNARPGISKNVTIRDNAISNCANAGIQLASVRHGVVAGNVIHECRTPVVAWDDGSRKPRFAVYGVDFRGQAGEIKLTGGGRNNLLPA
jgi:polygalacturonase